MVVVYTHDAVFISPDDTLTEGNVMDALTGVRLWNGSDSYKYLHMPESTHDEIVSRHPGEEEAAKRSLVSEFLSHHPLPSWTHIVKLIRELERHSMCRRGIVGQGKEQQTWSLTNTLKVSCTFMYNHYTLSRCPPHIHIMFLTRSSSCYIHSSCYTVHVYPFCLQRGRVHVYS